MDYGGQHGSQPDELVHLIHRLADAIADRQPPDQRNDEGAAMARHCHSSEQPEEQELVNTWLVWALHTKAFMPL